MKTLRAAAVALALAPAAFVLSMSSDASACGMSVRLEPIPQRPTPVQEIARAEKALEAGQASAAALAVKGSFPGFRSITPGKNPLETRALRVFALAVVRSDGAIDERTVHGGAAKWKKSANLEWAAQALREIDESRPNDPAVQADLGEALSKLPHKQGEALTILSKLAEKDLMGSPNAYAALASLRAAKGDDEGAQAALKRCSAMTKSTSVCRLPGSAPTAAKSPTKVAAATPQASGKALLAARF